MGGSSSQETACRKTKSQETRECVRITTAAGSWNINSETVTVREEALSGYIFKTQVHGPHSDSVTLEKTQESPCLINSPDGS